MPETRGSVRNRKAKAASKPAEVAVVEEVDTDEAEEIEKTRVEKKRTARERVEDEDDYSPWMDVLRVISFLIVASCGLSYLVSNGESFTWGLRHPPKYLDAAWWKAQWNGPVYLTLEELSEFDGRNESKPLYLAINGTIFDVSSNRRIYGPGGGYQYFAGTDAARSFVTGCFLEDRTADMRGAEEMYLPLDDAETDARWTAAELAELKAKERERALQKVHDGLEHWVKFFANSPKYPQVGYVKRDPDWLEKEPRKQLCESAAKGRKKRKIPEDR
ncbi:putative cytochrome b5-like heme steroid binding domain-containing protein [Eutypa lata UCREL1]|uniref:Putative cytochrome b5-like heme steroid binding domain-containing protein n=1 Tax=Eutypa lata (strain UCR-EL1) TaxID=1287681 RepID=M7SCI5_EUTLA|nr:putative cytochrome b5-like heme steroid binding domain-containing protein [Eutypa lata UCREL1]